MIKTRCCYVYTACLLIATSLGNAAFPPLPQNVITKSIRGVPDASISYKETHICKRMAKADAGNVNMPSTYLQDIQDDSPYNVSVFFWYLRSRQNPDRAPTTMYPGGGPGQSSVLGATSGGGPCLVLNDSNSTEGNPWSWNQYVNMLYVDQPVTTGFSHSDIIKGTLLLLWSNDGASLSSITPFQAYEGAVPAENTTFLHDIFPDQTPQHAPSNSVLAANALWRFSELWFAEFPAHKAEDKRINLTGSSCGGYWASTSAAYFQRQNGKTEAGALRGRCLRIDITIITNECIDLLYQAEWYPQIA